MEDFVEEDALGLGAEGQTGLPPISSRLRVEVDM